jgi:hypothetical protein
LASHNALSVMSCRPLGRLCCAAMVASMSMNSAIYAARSSSCNLSHWENVKSWWTTALVGHDNSSNAAAYLNTGAPKSLRPTRSQPPLATHRTPRRS